MGVENLGVIVIKNILKISSIVLLCSGCATIVSKSKYDVTIVSCPSEAEFVVKNQAGENVARGTTPMIVTLDSGDGYFNPANYKIYFRKKGYHEDSVSLESSLDGWYFGSILPIPALIFVVDPLTGAMWKLPGYTAISLKQDNIASLKKNLELASINSVNKPSFLCNR